VCGKDEGKGCKSVNVCKCCAYVYVNGKMRPAETIP
jgi:hypothetical protein